MICENNRKQNKSVFLFSVADLFLLLLIIFSLTTLFQALFDQISINRIVGAMIIGTCIVLIIGRKREIRIPLFWFILFINVSFSILFTLDLKAEVTDWIYFFTTILVLQVISQYDIITSLYRSFIRYSKWIAFIINVECFVLFLLLFLHIGYTNKWGTGEYFIGLCNGEHTMGSFCCLVLAFILLYCRGNNKHCGWYGFIALIPLYALFETGARIFLVPAAILVFLFLKSAIHNNVLRLFIYLCCFAIFLVMLSRSSMIDKFRFALNNIYAKNIWDSFTSGRSEFWICDLKYFFSGNIVQLMFGRTFSHVYFINRNTFGVAIWSHNDLIQLLNATGLTGTIIYVFQIKKVFTVLKRKIKDRMIYLSVFLYLMIPMMMNGFFIYQHFVYSFTLVYLSFMLPKERQIN